MVSLYVVPSIRPSRHIADTSALDKEVQGYYESGMTVPDDITLLWVDDNWGNIRRFPIESERNRTGGAGVYYHVDYVGTPRDYKWITVSSTSSAVFLDIRFLTIFPSVYPTA